MTDARPATLHERILSDVRDNILGGIWPPGHRIPFETDMAADYGVSRMTVNKALTQLTREGYLERRRKGGTFVARPRGQSAVMAIANIGEEVRERGGVYSFTLLNRIIRAAGPDDLALFPGIKAGQRIIALDYVHHADSEPFCHERRIINLTSVPLAEGADFAEEPAGTWLLRQVPWSSAEHLIRAVVAPPAVARLLGIAPATPCLEITRRTEFEGRPITFACLTYPGGKHQLAARFSPQDGSANL